MKQRQLFFWALTTSLLAPATVNKVAAADIVWTNTAGGNWNTAANWSPNVVPTAADNAWITNSGTYTVTINSAASVAAIQIGASSGSQTLSLGGTLSGAIVTAASGGAQLVANGGTLVGVTLDADVSIANLNSLSFTNGLTLTNGATITINSSGSSTFLYALPGTQTLGGTGQIVFAGSSSLNRLRLGQGGATTLTLGPNVTVRGRGWIDQNSPSTLLNQGTIQADVSGQALTITPNSFTQAGTLVALSNSFLTINSASWSNSGSIGVTNSTLTVAGNWSNTGTITAQSSTVNLGGTFTQASLGVFNRIGGLVNLTGTLNGGLMLDAGTGSWVFSGTINGGTVTASGGTDLVADGGTLVGVTLGMDLSIPNANTLSFTNGLTLTNGATITLNSSGSSTFLYALSGNQTLGGTGEIVFAGSSSQNRLRLGQGGTSTLTIGPNVTVRGRGWIDQSSPSTLLNQGTIQADVSGQALTITPNTFTQAGTLAALNGGVLTINSGSWSNSGSIGVTNSTLTVAGNWSNSGVISANNSTVNLGGSFTQAGLGTFNRTGGTVNLTGTLNGGLVLDAGTGSWVLSGTINGGTVTASGGTDLVVDGGTLVGVTLGMNLSIPNANTLSFANGLTLTNGATITLNSSGASTYLYVLAGAQTLGGTGQIVFPGSSSQNRLRLGQSGATTLTIGPNVTLRGRGAVDNLFTSTLINQGTIQADVSGQTFIVNLNILTNSGTIESKNNSLMNLFSTTYRQISGVTLLNGGNITASTPLQILGGTLAGTNTLTASVINSGVVSPGLSPGVLTISGNYTQTVSGILAIEIAGTNVGPGFDRLAVTGTASLAGTVNVALTNGFYPATNASFAFLTAGTRVGTFDTFNYPSSDVGMQVNYTGTNASVHVINVRPVLPTITAQTNDELVLFNLNAAGTDDDQPAQTLTYALTNSPSGATIDSGTGLISWTPTEEQGPLATNITVLVTDNGTPNLTVSRTFAITVNEINAPPAITLPPDQPINEQAPFATQATATDSDDPTNTWAFELVSGPPGLSVASDGAIAWTPDEAHGPGVYPVTVRVTDTNAIAVNEQSLSTTNTFTLTVQEVNLAPSLTVPTNQVVLEETALSVSASATDPDLPTNGLSFALLSPPTGMTIVPATGLIEWTPNEAQGPSSNLITVVVTDDSPNAINAQNLSVTNTFVVVVTESNRPPVLTVPTNQVMEELTLLAVGASATDADDPANPLTFALVVAPAGMTINTNTGAITWTPTESQGPSSNYVAVVVTDLNTNAVNAQQLSVTNSFRVVVNEVNAAPVLTVPTNQVMDELTLLAVSASATDADDPANPLTFALVVAPAGMTINTNTGALTWTPTESQGPSSNYVAVVVTDLNTNAVNTQQLSVTNSFSVVVNEVNVAPVVGSLADWSVNPGQTVSFTATATDEDSPANGLSYSLVSPPAGASISGGGLFQWRPSVALADTTNQVRVRVSDNGLPVLNGTNVFQVIVNPVAPVVLTPLGFSGGQFELHVTGTTGPDYFLMASTNLTDWLEVGTNLTPVTPFLFTDPAAGGFSNRVYRVRLGP